MPTRNVVLTDHLEQVIENLVKSGRYQNASEVLQDGLRLVEQRENFEAAKITALHEAARAGFTDLDQGRFTNVSIENVGGFIGSLGPAVGARIDKADA